MAKKGSFWKFPSQDPRFFGHWMRFQAAASMPCLPHLLMLFLFLFEAVVLRCGYLFVRGPWPFKATATLWPCASVARSRKQPQPSPIIECLVKSAKHVVLRPLRASLVGVAVANGSPLSPSCRPSCRPSSAVILLVTGFTLSGCVQKAPGYAGINVTGRAGLLTRGFRGWKDSGTPVMTSECPNKPWTIAR